MKTNPFIFLLTLAASATLLCQCASRSQVTYAPHRTSPSKAISGVVTSSYPVRYTKRSGAGAVLGSIGGAVLGSRVGSGYSARMAGSMAGSWAGGLGGHATEGAIRSRSAREITVRAAGRTFRTISTNNPPLQRGERVLVLTNVYGQMLSVTRSR